MSMSDPSSGEVAVEITSELIDDLVRLGGYTHPLFANRAADNDSSTDSDRPMPGQGVLLLMGGLVEQSGQLDGAVALLEMRAVRFHRKITAGTRLHVKIDRGAKSVTPGGRPLAEFTWTAVDCDGPVATAEVVMLMSQTQQGKTQGDQ